MINTKHLINSLESSVNENLFGLVSYNNGLQLVSECNSVVRKDIQTYAQNGKVLLISGGGAGHEPMFAGFVGSGLLTAAVSGDIFASPPTRRTVKLIENITQKQTKNEILIIVANYTGDSLNFGLAREQLLLKGYKIDFFVFGDDVAFYGEGKRVGRRGLAGISLIHKLSGAMAEKGMTLKQITDNLTQFSNLIGTMSVSLDSCNIPGTGSSFKLAPDQIELGLGAHGEAGVQRIKLCTAYDTVKTLVNNLVGKKSVLSEHIKKYDNRIVVLINNMGGLSQFELHIFIKEVMCQLEALSLKIERIYCGTFMTSFSMSGVSITTMAVNSNILELLDSPSTSSCWNQLLNCPKILNHSIYFKTSNSVPEEPEIDFQSIDGLDFNKELFVRSVELSCKALINSEKYLNELDTELGDGDCGSTLSTTSKHILKIISDNQLKPSFFQLSHIVQDSMGGTSGAIYSLMLTAASKAVQTNHSKIGQNSYDYINFWSDVLKYCMDTISRYSTAKPGDRTMLDSLNSALKALLECDHSLPYDKIAKSVSVSTKKGSESTASMIARVGRASYVKGIPITRPDPGAVAVSVWIDAIAQAFIEFFTRK